MFNDESGDQARSRKKREIAKANRQRAQELRKKKEVFLRAEAAKKEVAERENASSALPPLSTPVMTMTPPPPILPDIMNPKPPPKSCPSSSSSSPSSSISIVDQAALQRRQRQQQQKVVRGVTILQSHTRRRLHRKRILKALRKDFENKILTISKLMDVVASSVASSSPSATSAASYKVPPATASQMVTQYLFITGDTPDVKLLTQLVSFTLINGLSADSKSSLHPLLSWLHHSPGKRRLENLLSHVIDALPYLDAGPKSAPIMTFLSSLLFPPSPLSSDEAVGRLSSFSRDVILCSICAISKLRDHLMSRKQSPSGDGPIPSDLSRVKYSSVFFQFVWDLITSDSKNKSRSNNNNNNKNKNNNNNNIIIINNNNANAILNFALGILSVPLLSHKLSNEHLKNLQQQLHIFSRSLLEQQALLSTDSPTHIPLSILLPQYSPTSNPCPPNLALFANIIMLCRSTSPDPLFTIPLLTVLLDEIPLGTFSHAAAVTWIVDGTVSKPVVIPEQITRQARGFFADSFLQRLIQSAFFGSKDKIDDMLGEKNKEDREHEESFEKGAKSAAAMASANVKETRRRKSSWTSGFSKKISSLAMISSLLGGSKKKTPSETMTPGGLVNTSSVSSKLACGDVATRLNYQQPHNSSSPPSNSPTSAKNLNDTPDLIDIDHPVNVALLLSVIIARWGGVGGGRDVDEKQASRKREPYVTTMLNSLCFSTNLLKSIWLIICSNSEVRRDVEIILSSRHDSNSLVSIDCLDYILKNPIVGSATSKSYEQRNFGVVRSLALIQVFSMSFGHSLMITDDAEIHETGNPLPLHHVRRVINLLKKLVFKSCRDSKKGRDRDRPGAVHYFGKSLNVCNASVLSDLSSRHSRKPLGSTDLWMIKNDELSSLLKRCKRFEEFVQLLQLPILKVMPYAVPLKQRLKLFECIVKTHRESIQGSNANNNLRPGINVSITRGMVLEDGMRYLNALGERMKQRIVVSYRNEVGVMERGIDVGGLFKEFWCDLSALAFSPDYALFCAIENDENGALFPNPSCFSAHGEDAVELYNFLGKILGKALFEGITIQPVFAHFFLAFIRGNYNYMHILPDLATKDPQLHNNLMFLKTYEGDAEDLCLTFSVNDDDFGSGAVVELISGGKEIDVTNENKHRYINLVAKHHVHDRLRKQAEAFGKGLWSVIDKSWLQLFNEPELQVLISGASGGKIDVEDMKSNTKYMGGYTFIDKRIAWFWSILAEMSVEEQGLLLKFVTSCERPPPLGFQSMNPSFNIMRIAINTDSEKLPSASTCFNTLKLPTYSSRSIMKSKLLFSIRSGAGFEMS